MDTLTPEEFDALIHLRGVAASFLRERYGDPPPPPDCPCRGCRALSLTERLTQAALPSAGVPLTPGETLTLGDKVRRAERIPGAEGAGLIQPFHPGYGGANGDGEEA